MPSYKDEKTGLWFCKFNYRDYKGDIKQKKKSGFEKRKDAQAWERDFLLASQGQPNMLFADFLEIYKKDNYPQLRERTQQTKNERYKRVIPTFGNIPLDEIQPLDIKKWQNSMINEGLSSKYIQSIQNEFSTVLNHAVRFYGLKENPIHRVGKAKVPNEIKPPMRFWTLEEFKEIYQCIDDIKAKTAINILYWTGIRKGELLALKWSCIDFDNKTLRVESSLQRLKGRDVITPTKTYESRVITLADTTIEILKEYQSKIYNPRDDDLIFDWEKRFIENGIKQGVEKANQEIKAYNKINEIKRKPIKRIHVHGLRHSHASYLINHNVNIVLISKRLGHKNTSITLDTYSHFYPLADDKMVEMMNKDSLEIQWKKYIISTKNFDKAIKRV